MRCDDDSFGTFWRVRLIEETIWRTRLRRFAISKKPMEQPSAASRLDSQQAQRQAFMLHALEDYNEAEIAMLQDRPESCVKADVEAARQLLKVRLTADHRNPKAARRKKSAGVARQQE